MNDQIYWASADVLVLAVQLPRAANLPPASELQQRLINALDGMMAKGKSAGVPDEDLAEARYALTAFLDEQILKSNWPGRVEWMNQPLQMMLFREYTAGENFFARMTGLMQRATPSSALLIFYLCLALGFRGAYGVSGDLRTLQSYTESSRQQLGRIVSTAAKIGPHALPADRASAVRLSNAVVYALVLGCVVLVAGVLFGLSYTLRGEFAKAMQLMPEPAAAAPVKAQVK